MKGFKYRDYAHLFLLYPFNKKFFGSDFNMKECILHIGMHKTGTTSIQNYLHGNTELLPDGIVYADLGTPNHSGPFCYAFKSGIEQHPYFNRRGHSLDDFDNLRQNFQSRIKEQLAREFRTIIFSAEDMVALEVNDLKKLHEILKRYVDRVRVIAYLRPPVEFAESAFQEMVKAYPVEPLPHIIFPRYKELFDKFIKEFSDVTFYLYDKSRFHNKNVVYDFCSKFSIPVRVEDKSNTSLSDLAVKFLYKYQLSRENVTISHERTTLLENILAPLEGKRFRLDAGVVDNALVANIEENEWAAKQLNIAIESFVDRRSQEHSVTASDLRIFSDAEISQILKLPRVKELIALVNKECRCSLPELLEGLTSTKEMTNSLVQYSLDIFTENLISGWALNIVSPKDKFTVQIYEQDSFVVEQVADKYREDLKVSAIGDGCVSFRFDLSDIKLDLKKVAVFIDGKLLHKGA